jgi:hypothetical protein
MKKIKKLSTSNSYPKSDFETKIDKNGHRWMLCQNSIPNGKYWKGKLCDNWTIVDRVAVSVLCWKCTANISEPPEIRTVVEKSNHPKGWKRMNVFVANDGSVYHKGIEQTTLKGTLPVTVIQKKVPKQKFTIQQHQFQSGELQEELQKIKSALFTEVRKTERYALTKQLAQLQRVIKKFS